MTAEQVAEQVAEDAANSTTALNPVIGVSAGDIVTSLWKTAYNIVRQPLSVAEHTARFGRKLVEISDGRREYLPSPKDRRFKDGSWEKQGVYRFWMQSYFALEESLSDWVSDAEFTSLDEQRANFIISLIVDSIAPTNTLVGNPAALKKAWETNGISLVKGAGNFIQDLKSNGGMPSQVDKSQFDVGNNLANSPGQVVFRNDVLELIQYAPQTTKVSEIPLLIVPPQINKFYIYDLTEEKSFVSYCASQGIQTFMISWRNPSTKQKGWNMSIYILALVEAVAAIKSITKQEKLNLMGGCSGGITGSILMGYMESKGDKTINSLSLSVCTLSQHEDDSKISLFINDDRIESSRKHSEKEGILKGAELARLFAWMRPNDLIWNYVVNNYFMGQKPPAFDVLYWNNDTTNLPAGLHSDYLDIVGRGLLESEGETQIDGQQINLKQSDCDKYIIAGQTDHITPWQACYRSTEIMGGAKQFVLCSSGHVQTLLCPAGNPKSRFHTNENLQTNAQQWLEDSESHEGTWWENWKQWLLPRSGNEKAAPKVLGNKDYKPLVAAPGTYVRHGA
jgi:polyhydroxyalkanoate synthase